MQPALSKSPKILSVSGDFASHGPQCAAVLLIAGMLPFLQQRRTSFITDLSRRYADVCRYAR